MVKINLHSLGEGEHKFDFEENESEFSIENVKLLSPVKISVIADKVSTQINLKIQISGKFVLECDRCLKDYENNFQSTFPLILKYDFTGELSGKENLDPELVYIPKEQHSYDLTKDIRDFIILSIPMRIIPEENAEGNCKECGMKISNLFNNSGNEEQINPVWETLLKERKN